jgi:hypothetical protein
MDMQATSPAGDKGAIKEPLIAGTTSALTTAQHRLDEVIGVLESVADRILGAIPQPGSGAQAQAEPVSQSDALQRAVQGVNVRASRLIEVASRLSNEL